MATTFKTLLPSDVVDTRTKLHENIPITGTIVSGTYNNENIQTHTHAMFTAVYDYPYLSSSANHIYDVTAGYSSNSALSGTHAVGGTLSTQKINLYNQMAQVLVGHDATGSIRDFDEDGNLTGGTKLQEVFFLNFARLLTKDEIKKGTFQLDMFVSGGSNSLLVGSQPDGGNDAGTGAARAQKVTIKDVGAATNFFVNSPAGEYGILYQNQGSFTNTSNSVGLIYYQAGVAVLTASLFDSGSTGTGTVPLKQNSILAHNTHLLNTGAITGSSALLVTASLDNIAKVINHRISNISFNNTTELNSSVYFCRANANEFNYSSNPTYLSSSQLRVKSTADDEPVSYITTVGLYGANNELLAVAKLSEPIKKTPANELTVRVRLDY
tara:strand:- start:361 stop:1506 length:1146 start_codon:yes stop_codon:yes gene_type:complete